MFSKYLHNGVLLLYQLHCSENKKNHQLLDYKQNVEAERRSLFVRHSYLPAMNFSRLVKLVKFQ